MSKTIHTTERKYTGTVGSSALQYWLTFGIKEPSLRERLGAGSYVFVGGKTDPRISLMDVLKKSIGQVAANTFFLSSHNLNSLKMGSRDSTDKQKISLDLYAGFLNPFVLLEIITSCLLNFATYYHDPAHDSTLRRAAGYLSIIPAYFVHATAKTLNVVATPILLTLAVLTVMALSGLALPITLAVAGGITLLLGGVSMRQWGWLNTLSSFAMTLCNPVIRMSLKYIELWKIRPVVAGLTTLAIAGVLAATVMFAPVLLPMASMATAYLLGFIPVTFSATAVSIATYTTLSAMALGAIELCVRAGKGLSQMLDREARIDLFNTSTENPSTPPPAREEQHPKHTTLWCYQQHVQDSTTKAPPVMTDPLLYAVNKSSSGSAP